MTTTAPRSLAAWFSWVGREISPEDVPEWLGERAPERTVWDERRRAWLVPGYERVSVVCRDESRFRSPMVAPADEPISRARALYERFEGPQKIVTLRADQHARLHRWWMRMFSERRIRDFRDGIVLPVIDGAIDRFVERGSAELVDELCDRIALPINLRMMGVDAGDDFAAEWTHLLQRYHTARLTLLRAADAYAADLHATVDEDEALAAGDELRELIRPLVRERRSGEADDYISLLWRDAHALFDEPWDEEAVIDNVIVMWEGGTHSTAHTAVTCLYVLSRHPELQQQIRKGAVSASAFCEETMRLYGPSVTLIRVADHDLEFDGARMKRGDVVLGLAAAASRDPSRHDRPHELNPHRDGVRDHFTFGFGPRLCVGHGMARAVLQELVDSVVRRLPELRPDPDAEPARFLELGRRAWSPVHVLFTPGPRSEAA